MLFTDVMTVYNYHRNPASDTDVWQRTIIRGIQWSHNRIDTNTVGSVQTESRVESITVDFQKSYGNPEYIPPQEYKALDENQKGSYWTLDSSTVNDILVLGESYQEIVSGYKISDLRNDFQYVGTVSSVSDNRNRRMLKSIKVVAK